ncbi:competence type IV pilus minor pilin ComGF [Macrococcus capreoli]
MLKSSSTKEGVILKGIRSVTKKIKSTVFQQSNGFTLIEMMINLSILVMILSLLPLIYIHLFQLSGKSVDHFDVNHAMFLRDLYEELEHADYIEIKQQQLWIYKGKDVIQYLYHNNRIVRKLNGTGYVIMLEGVNHATFREEKSSVYLSIERYRKRLVTFKII